MYVKPIYLVIRSSNGYKMKGVIFVELKMRNDFILLILFRERCSVLEYSLQIEFIHRKLENTLQRNQNSIGVLSFH